MIESRPAHHRLSKLALSAASAALLATLAPLTARAQADEPWPSRPINIVVASGVGTGVDLLARAMGQRMSAALKQPVIVDNKPGANGVLGAQAVIRTKPDGYTLLYSNASNFAVAPALVKSLPFDTVRDFTPIAQTAAGGILLMVNKSVPASTLPELIALVKAYPGKFNYGTWGTGSTGHMVTEWLSAKAGIRMVHVPYKTTPQVVSDLASGVLQVGWSDPTTPIPMLEQGLIKGIAINGNTRSPRTATIPTMTEQGYPFNAVGWFGVFGPAGMAKPLVDRLNREVNLAHRDPEMAKRMEGMNLEPFPNKTADEFRTILANDIRTWQGIVKEANIPVE